VGVTCLPVRPQMPIRSPGDMERVIFFRTSGDSGLSSSVRSMIT
jgi:hypothetical protein